MAKYIGLIILGNLILLLIYFNTSIAKKEKILDDGQLVLLNLAPVDPRSLMQGDYMALRYSIGMLDYNDSIPKRGYIVVTLDSTAVADRVRFQEDQTPLKSGEQLIEYNALNSWNVHIGAESYFFEEGQAEKYEKAAYGGLKIDKHGNSILIGLYDDNKQLIQ
ncbi:GDYXXLXY domain-containing protein [Sphingobacterium hungaricum]|uniref:Membrane-anchored protein n=1 Tax=Sphingobacterium hungaricum TaxID=2082723 RepID=A0A928UYP9_9SPHI|nr:GDYXXLXY domain-containing protein [Sphingobacterium hungaricum]MBE8715132.1 hypothetical protein [Sphingobacterium hungaricum]